MKMLTTSVFTFLFHYIKSFSVYSVALVENGARTGSCIVSFGSNFCHFSLYLKTSLYIFLYESVEGEGESLVPCLEILLLALKEVK